MLKKAVTCELIALFTVAIYSANASYEGYTFFTSGATAYLYDKNGDSVHTWRASSFAQTCAYLLPDGSALFPLRNFSCNARHDGACPSGRFQKISWEGDIIWDYTACDATFMPGYDVEPMPNGNILIPAEADVGAAKLIEVKPTGAATGEVVWQYTIPDSLNSGNTYCNSVSYNPDLDLILMDLQEPVRKLVVIDHSGAGSVVFTYLVGSSGRLHAAAWVTKYFLGTKTLLPDADTAAIRINNLLVVHNSSEVVEFNMTTKTKRSITFSFANNEGSVQRLPNGNTLVTPGMSRKIAQIDDNGTKISSITAPGSVNRAYCYGPDYAGLSGLSVAMLKRRTAVNAAAGTFSYNAIANTGKIVFTNSNVAPFGIRIVSLNGKTVHESWSHGREAVFSTEKLLPGVYYTTVRHLSGSSGNRFVKMQ